MPDPGAAQPLSREMESLCNDKIYQQAPNTAYNLLSKLHQYDNDSIPLSRLIQT
jgi:hypothetical protein